MNEPKCPECEKLHGVKDKSQAIGEFLEWMYSKGYQFARVHQHTDSCFTNGFQTKTAFRAEYKGKKRRLPFSGEMVPICTPAELEAGRFNKPACGIESGTLLSEFVPMERTLAEFFEIDLAKVEEEKRAVLRFVQHRQDLAARGETPTDPQS